MLVSYELNIITSESHYARLSRQRSLFLPCWRYRHLHSQKGVTYLFLHNFLKIVLLSILVHGLLQLLTQQCDSALLFLEPTFSLCLLKFFFFKKKELKISGFITKCNFNFF